MVSVSRDHGLFYHKFYSGVTRARRYKSGKKKDTVAAEIDRVGIAPGASTCTSPELSTISTSSSPPPLAPATLSLHYYCVLPQSPWTFGYNRKFGSVRLKIFRFPTNKHRLVIQKNENRRISVRFVNSVFGF